MANALAQEMVAPLKGRKGNHGVILHALMLMHRQVVRTMSAEHQREVGYELAGYAGQLIAVPHEASTPRHEPHQFPTDLPTTMQ